MKFREGWDNPNVFQETSKLFVFFVNLRKKQDNMGHDAIKLELIEWLTKLDDDDTLDFLKIVKESREVSQDWWYDLTHEQKLGIERGLKDIDSGNVTPHSEITSKYGL